MSFKTLSFILVCLSLLIGGIASAKGKSRHSKARGYSYFVDGAKASQGECDGEGKIPRRLKKQKELLKNQQYIGSESMEGNGNEPSWKHYFTTKTACDDSLRRSANSK